MPAVGRSRVLRERMAMVVVVIGEEGERRRTGGGMVCCHLQPMVMDGVNVNMCTICTNNQQLFDQMNYVEFHVNVIIMLKNVVCFKTN